MNVATYFALKTAFHIRNNSIGPQGDTGHGAHANISLKYSHFVFKGKR